MTEKKGENNNINLKVGLAEMLRGGVIMDVVSVDEAKVAEDAGAVAVMALERVPSDIRKDGGVARMTSPELIEGIMGAVNIPVMAKCRIGHFVEAQILQEIGVDYIDESEVLTPADNENHIHKKDFHIPFVCGAVGLGEALRRISEGASLIRSKGEAGTGNIIEAVQHLRQIRMDIKRVMDADESELMSIAKNLAAPIELLYYIKNNKSLPTPLFAAGGVATPADAALCMQLGAQSIFVGSGIFKSENPERFAKAIVRSVASYSNPEELLKSAKGLPEAMPGLGLRMDSQLVSFSERGL